MLGFAVAQTQNSKLLTLNYHDRLAHTIYHRPPSARARHCAGWAAERAGAAAARSAKKREASQRLADRPLDGQAPDPDIHRAENRRAAAAAYIDGAERPGWRAAHHCRL